MRQLLVILCHKMENRRDTLVGCELTDHRRDYFRRFSRSFWSATVTGVQQRSPLKDDRMLQQTLNVYIRLGRLLGMGDPANVSPYPDLDTESSYRVCHWRGCLCSAFKPTHRLRECKGCKKAIYYNRSC